MVSIFRPPIATTSTAEADFAVLVRLLRQARKLTQQQFAHELDVTIGTLSGWENGHHSPLRAQRKRLLRLADRAGIQVPHLSPALAGRAR